MPSAPTFHGVGRVEQTYRTWAEHYNECVTCQRDDWYTPTEGEPMLCTKGRALFRAWVKLVQQVPPLRQADLQLMR